MEVPKQQRLQEVYRRLAEAPAARTFTEMRHQVDNILNEVEDLLTAIPYDLRSWATDGRLYPVQDDNVYDVEGHTGVTLLRARRSEIYIGENGAIEIRDAASGAVELRKAGADGREVWNLP